jgi:hypothetical protein
MADRTLEDELEDAPAGPNSPNAAFDEGFEQAKREFQGITKGLAGIARRRTPARPDGSGIRRADAADIEKRKNLPRYGSTPIVPDTSRLAARVPLPAHQWGFPTIDSLGRGGAADAYPIGPLGRSGSELLAIRPVLSNKLARADAMLGGSITGRPLRPSTLENLDNLATDLQQRNRNAPASLGPGLRPNLAMLDPVSAEVKAWQEKADHNTLMPQQFLAARGNRTAAPGAPAVGPQTESEFGRGLIARDPLVNLLNDVEAENGQLKPLRSRYSQENHDAQLRALGTRATTNHPRPLDEESLDEVLAANREKYLQNREATLAARKGVVQSRAMGRGLERFLAMNPRAAQAMGIGAEGSPGSPSGQQFDPVQSAMFGAWLGAMTGHPGLAADFARGAGEFNARSAEQAASARESALNRGLANDQLAEQKRHNVAGEGIGLQESTNRQTQHLLDLIENHPYLRIAGSFPEGSEQRRKAMQAYHMAVAPIVARLQAMGVDSDAATPKGAAAPAIPVGGTGDVPGLFGDTADEDIAAGKLSEAAYQKMRSLHPKEIVPGILPDWFPGTESIARATLFQHFKRMFPGVDPVTIGKLANQYYDRYYNTVAAPAAS